VGVGALAIIDDINNDHGLSDTVHADRNSCPTSCIHSDGSLGLTSPIWRPPRKAGDAIPCSRQAARLIASSTLVKERLGAERRPSRSFVSPPPWCDIHSTLRAQTATVTRRNVAGIEVVPGFELSFLALNRATSSSSSSAVRPFAVAASNAFMVGP
jgi:hypothetical protein